mgnify:CR=1 FL=1
MSRINECGHPERKHNAKGMCQKCYQATPEVKAREVERRARPENKSRKAERMAKYWSRPEVKARKAERRARPENKAYNAAYQLNKRRTDIQFRLAQNLRRRTRGALKNNQKVGSAVFDLGCSIAEFKLHIENKFEPGMTWDNYRKWHLDHIQPLSLFDLTDRAQFLTACNWQNYQPLWAVDNIRKSGQAGAQLNLMDTGEGRELQFEEWRG